MRQVEILCLLASGRTSRDAAEFLSISEHTVIRHVSNMMCLFEAKNRLELLSLAVVCDIIDVEHWPLRPSGKLSLESLSKVRYSCNDHSSAGLYEH